MTFAAGYRGTELEDKLGIPVVCLSYGGADPFSEQVTASLRILGKILLILLIIAVIYLAGVITGILISQTPVIQNLTQFIP